MSTQYQQKLSDVARLVGKMDLPAHRKSVKHNDDLRWLKNNLKIRNSKHKNYEQIMELLKDVG
jgi:hypothetical protein